MTASDGRYRRARNLAVEIDSGGEVVIHGSSGAIPCGSHGLAILEAFAEPVPIAAGLAVLADRTSGREDYFDLTATVMKLVREGVLVDDGETPAPVTRGGRNYPVGIHVSMLADDVRTSTFLAAVRHVVQPGDVVVEIGAGSGVLAVAAAQAGARRVYAIDASVGDWVRSVAAANGVGEQVVVIDGWSFSVELPERADVLISETLGNDALEEGLLAIVLDARARMLKPDARIVPQHIQVLAAPVEVPETMRLTRVVERARADEWSARYGVDLTPLVDLTAENRAVTTLSPRDARELRALSPPCLVADIDLATVAAPSLVASATADVDVAGRVDGVVSWFAAELAPGHRLERPANSDDTAHWNWRYPLWTRPPLDVAPGDQLELTYRHRIGAVARHELFTVERVTSEQRRP